MICLKKDVLANFFHFASAASLFAKYARSPFFLLSESARRKGECGARFMVCPEKARRRGKLRAQSRQQAANAGVFLKITENRRRQLAEIFVNFFLSLLLTDSTATAPPRIASMRER